MEERWRRPLNVIDVEHHPSEGIWLPDGRVQGQVRIIYDRESTERIRSGYACAKCMQVFEHAWPVRCDVCGAPIRERQAEYFAKEFDTVETGPKTSLREELETIRERAEREERS
jgi:hypothetical protein